MKMEKMVLTISAKVNTTICDNESLFPTAVCHNTTFPSRHQFTLRPKRKDGFCSVRQKLTAERTKEK
jgi:hypothetical protein